jgi:hypothetical protein
MEGRMHGLVNRVIEEFARETYGDAVWVATAVATGIDPRGIEIMGEHDAELTGRLLANLARQHDRSPQDLAEDLGAWVAQIASVRRLLRFAGGDFTGFMMTLEELRGRGQLVTRDLYLPPLSVAPTGQGWEVRSDCERLWLHAVAGMLHAMADDYGVLAVIDVELGRIRVDVPMLNFNAGRPFSLSDPAVGAP